MAFMMGWAAQLFGAVLAGTDWYPPLCDGGGVAVVDDDTRSELSWFPIEFTDWDCGEDCAAVCPARAWEIPRDEEGPIMIRERRQARIFLTGRLFFS